MKDGKMKIKETIEKDFSGCISVVKNGAVIFEESYGFADLTNEIPNRLDTKFATASAGKVFVAVAILQLIESGKLRFENFYVIHLAFQIILMKVLWMNMTNYGRIILTIKLGIHLI